MNHLRRITLVALTALAPALVAAQALPERIAKTKVIRIAVNAIYPPMEFKDPETGKLTGFDVDLGNALAKELGVTLEWQESAFEQLLPSLATGRVDMILSGLSDRPARREASDFIDYLNSGVQFYVLASRADVSKPVDLCGKTVGTSRSTSFPAEIKTWSDANCVAAGKAPITVEGTSDNAAARAQLKQGRFEGGAQGSETVPYVMSQEAGIYKAVGTPFGGLQQGIAFTKADSQLRDAVLVAFKKLLAMALTPRSSRSGTCSRAPSSRRRSTARFRRECCIGGRGKGGSGGVPGDRRADLRLSIG